MLQDKANLYFLKAYIYDNTLIKIPINPFPGKFFVKGIVLKTSHTTVIQGMLATYHQILRATCQYLHMTWQLDS